MKIKFSIFCVQGIFPGDYKVVSDGDLCMSFMEPEHNYAASTGTNSRNGKLFMLFQNCKFENNKLGGGSLRHFFN